MSIEKQIEALNSFEAGFDRLISEFEERINGLDDKVKKFAENNCQEIVAAFLELKQDLKRRLSQVEDKNLEFIPSALNELKKLLNLIADILEDDFEGYRVRNKFNKEETELVYSVFEKRAESKRVEVGFNFIPTENGQARVKINYWDMAGGERYSLRVDRDEKYGGVFIDLDTPNINKIFDGIKDEKGGWHHFKSLALDNFVAQDKFTQLIKVFKDILTQLPEEEYFSIQDLIK